MAHGMQRLATTMVVLAAVAVTSLGVAGCDGLGGDSNNDSRAFLAPDDSSAESGGASGSVTADRAGEVDLAAARRPDAREVVYTADMEVGTKDVERASDEARQVVADAGGFLFSASEHGLDDTHPSVTLTFKVPPERFDAVLASLAELGDVAERSVNAEDVTGRIVDLDARLAAARTSSDRLRELLADTGNVGDLLNVERELAAREAQVESLAGQMTALRDQVDLATITVNIVEPSETSPEVSDDIPGFIKGLKTGGAAFVNVLLIVATALGFALPFLAAAVVIGGPVFLIMRRRRRTGAGGDS